MIQQGNHPFYILYQLSLKVVKFVWKFIIVDCLHLFMLGTVYSLQNYNVIKVVQLNVPLLLLVFFFCL